MFVQDKHEEIRKKLVEYIQNKLIDRTMLAKSIGISLKTLMRFLDEKPVQSSTLLKVVTFLNDNK